MRLFTLCCFLTCQIEIIKKNHPPTVTLSHTHTLLHPSPSFIPSFIQSDDGNRIDVLGFFLLVPLQFVVCVFVEDVLFCLED
ncbi:hypothetical protein QVD17_35364 [Tagetes erecta]|uniref:Uncharacterized protein n=1 Tax=Tagetes erecta TaxID=13708 RepID=A0AAD8K1A8_TARER|nr:hypothetical protein QVD17_35364 [Tagetes erecta]